MTSTSLDLEGRAPRVGGVAPYRRRGLLDAVLMLVLLYAVYAKTPLGAIAETAVNVARGQKARPSWLATFKGRETAVRVDDEIVADATGAQSDLPAVVVAAANRHGVDPETLAALMTAQRTGTTAPGGAVPAEATCSDKTPAACVIDAPPRVGNVLPSLAGKAQLTVDEAAQALAAGQKQLENDPELAIEALWIGPIPVTLAVEQARRSSLADPKDVEAHAEFLSPSTRRGPLQAALSVIAVHRLRTMAWPADPRFRISSPFGPRTHPVTGRPSFHNGTDISTPSGTPLLAAHKGGIKRQSRDSISGNYVVIDHGLGIETVYCHLTEAGVVEGQRVKRKETIGISGATGRVTGPHLHYIIKVREQPIDAETVGESPTRKAGLRVDVPPPPPDPPAAPPKPAKPTKAAKPVKPPKGAPAAVDAGPANAPTQAPAAPTPPTPAPPADTPPSSAAPTAPAPPAAPAPPDVAETRDAGG